MNLKKSIRRILREDSRVYDYDPERNTVPFDERLPFDVDKLLSVGAVFITPAIDGDPKSKTYKEWLNEPYVHLITLKNVFDSNPDSWIHKAITKKGDPELYRKDFVYKFYDGKYNQILWSLEKLGIDPNDMIEDKNNSIQESIKRILREDSNIPRVILRRVTLDELDKIFERSLDDNTEDYENPLSIMYGKPYKTFAKFVIDIMISELEGDFGIPFIDDTDLYNEKYREPLLRHYAPIIKDRYMDITSNNVDESVLREEINPIARRIFRRADQKKLDKIFVDGLGIMTARYLQNQHNWHDMTFNKFKQTIISYLIVDMCTKYTDICFGTEDFYDRVWDFMSNYYSDRIEERWEEIKPKGINESIENGKKVYYGFQGLPNFWANDQDNVKGDKYFEDKNYEDYYFDNFYDMDAQFGNENSLFGTRGLPVGHPDRSSKSFNRYNEKYGPIIVRVVKETL